MGEGMMGFGIDTTKEQSANIMAEKEEQEEAKKEKGRKLMVIMPLMTSLIKVMLEVISLANLNKVVMMLALLISLDNSKSQKKVINKSSNKLLKVVNNNNSSRPLVAEDLMISLAKVVQDRKKSLNLPAERTKSPLKVEVVAPCSVAQN